MRHLQESSDLIQSLAKQPHIFYFVVLNVLLWMGCWPCRLWITGVLGPTARGADPRLRAPRFSRPLARDKLGLICGPIGARDFPVHHYRMLQ